MPNLLQNSPSAYLQQHAHNPVDWWPWGNEAWETAAAKGQWVVLSIGYSTCHWCHAMERDVFEQPAAAEAMSDFVCIKVDREERPDVDQVYMQAALAMNGNGGWPLNLSVLPDGRPIWAGTYLTLDRWMDLLQRIRTVRTTQPAAADDYGGFEGEDGAAEAAAAAEAAVLAEEEAGREKWVGNAVMMKGTK